MRTWAALAWRSWTGWTTHIGNFQARVLLTLVYFTWLAPFGILVGLFGDPLDIRGIHRSPLPTAWKKCTTQKRDLRALRGQF